MHQEFESPEALRDTIKCFWYERRVPGERPPVFEVMPDSYAEIIFLFGDCRISVHGEWQLLPSPFIMGLLNRPVVLRADHGMEVLAVRCYPWTVFDLLGLPPGKSSVHVFEHPVAALQPSLHQLIQVGRIAEAVAELQRYFLDARSQVAMNSMLFKAGVAMNKAMGSLPVSGVAAAAHATVRTLERKFKASSGYTVKDVSGLIRFEQVRNRLWHYPDTNVAGLAAELGYTDQAHLSREFKRYSGVTPGAFARKARKEQGAVSDDFVAFIQS